MNQGCVMLCADVALGGARLAGDVDARERRGGAGALLDDLRSSSP